MRLDLAVQLRRTADLQVDVDKRKAMFEQLMNTVQTLTAAQTPKKT